jgi:hypothetical protein
MNEVFCERAAALARLAATFRSGLEQAEATIPAINDQLSQLAMLGIRCQSGSEDSLLTGPRPWRP